VAEAIYIEAPDGLSATELSRGPWDPGAQHGGAPAAVIVRAFERLEGGPELALARVTYELLRPVPLGPLSLEASVVRPGRRVQLLEATLRRPDGVEVVRARAVRVRRADVERTGDGESSPPPGPEAGTPNDFDRRGQVMFATDAMEIRFVSGSFYEPGPATAWFRLTAPLVAGEAPSPLQRLAAAADFPNGIASPLSWTDYVFINPDLTIYVEREPLGEWIALAAQMRVHDGGVGYAEATLYDHQGRVGRSSQTLLISRRER
jgi:hypothetical protein